MSDYEMENAECEQLHTSVYFVVHEEDIICIFHVCLSRNTKCIIESTPVKILPSALCGVLLLGTLFYSEIVRKNRTR